MGTYKYLRPTSVFLRERYHGSGWSNNFRTYNAERYLQPDKVNGKVQTRNGKFFFRNATDRSTFRSWLEPSQAQVFDGISTEFYSKGSRSQIETSAGGYRPDKIFEAYGNLTPKNSLGLGDLYGPIGIPTALRNELVTKALNKIADQKANLGENLATLHQTIGLMKSPLSSLVEGVRSVYANKALRPFLYKSARDIRRAGPVNVAAAEYLKYVYGWKPLMQDVYGLIEMAKGSAKNPLLLNATVSKKSQEQSALKTYFDPSNITSNELGPCDVRSRASCSLWAEVNPNAANIRSLNQLGLLNPASLAWELVPWSFVVDWLVPIGPVLSAFTAPVGLNFVNGSISNRVSSGGPYTHWRVRMDGEHTFNVKQKATGRWCYEGYKRQQLTDWPLPGFWVDFDPFRGDRPLKALALGIMKLRSLR